MVVDSKKNPKKKPSQFAVNCIQRPYVLSSSLLPFCSKKQKQVVNLGNKLHTNEKYNSWRVNKPHAKCFQISFPHSQHSMHHKHLGSQCYLSLPLTVLTCFKTFNHLTVFLTISERHCISFSKKQFYSFVPFLYSGEEPWWLYPLRPSPTCVQGTGSTATSRQGLPSPATGWLCRPLQPPRPQWGQHTKQPAHTLLQEKNLHLCRQHPHRYQPL